MTRTLSEAFAERDRMVNEHGMPYTTKPELAGICSLARTLRLFPDYTSIECLETGVMNRKDVLTLEHILSVRDSMPSPADYIFICPEWYECFS